MITNESELSNEDNYIKPEFHKQLDDFLANAEHKYKTIQSLVCVHVIERIYRRVKLGYGRHFGGVKVNIEENLIIDGNHRYIAYEMAGFDYEIIPQNKNHCDKPPYRDIKTFEVDYEVDWDMGHPHTRKFCNDDFLKDFDRD
ncbi:hypothetical protein MP478_16465 [Chryseobacterium sp. WG14]|uniref:hypothetical protein n=1 Tax=Chryseobacterium sp. WG14 TaxID=2926909 RepID=UPI00211E6928|nr:hypothetical protein [Chryseobacterium sp. WG14]MCQ9640979.1 hypothetical protein [Chryseobacterium sp. WG14]